VVCDGIIAQHVAPHLRLLLARPGDCLAVIERTLAVLPREWVVGNAVASVRSVASTLGQMVRSQPESHGAAAAAAADARGKAVDPQRLVAVLAALGDKSEAQTVAELFGIATVL
jgi:GC-rich sequence DNA-binding factor